MDLRHALEFAIWVGLVAARVIVRAAQLTLEWIFVLATWIALLAVGIVMAFQRGGLPWTDPSDARATSRSPGSIVRRAPRR